MILANVKISPAFLQALVAQLSFFLKYKNKMGANRGQRSMQPVLPYLCKTRGSQSSGFQTGIQCWPAAPATFAGVGGAGAVFQALPSPEVILKNSQDGGPFSMLYEVRSVLDIHDLLLRLKLLPEPKGIEIVTQEKVYQTDLNVSHKY